MVQTERSAEELDQGARLAIVGKIFFGALKRVRAREAKRLTLVKGSRSGQRQQQVPRR